jgi:hypothetical protein
MSKKLSIENMIRRISFGSKYFSVPANNISSRGESSRRRNLLEEQTGRKKIL